MTSLTGLCSACTKVFRFLCKYDSMIPVPNVITFATLLPKFIIKVQNSYRVSLNLMNEQARVLSELGNGFATNSANLLAIDKSTFTLL